MNKSLNNERKKVSNAVRIILNDWWKNVAHVEIIHDTMMWFSLRYTSDFDVRNELKALGITYNPHPRNDVRNEYVQDFFLDHNIFTKIQERVRSERN